MPPLTAEKVVLCVDDDSRLLRMIGSYLEAFGYVIVAETTGHAALKRVAVQPFFAAVLDYFIPDLNGGEVAAEIHRLQPDAAIIMFTGSRQLVPSRVTAISDVVLSKADGMDALLAALGRVPELRHPKPVRRFPRYPVQLPIVVRIHVPGRTASLHGTTITLAEGGLGGRLDGEVLPGDDVVIEFEDPRLLSCQPRAQVRYRNGDVYGFEFIGLDAQQQAVLRQSCQHWASS